MSEDRGAKRNRGGAGNGVWLLVALIVVVGVLMGFYLLRPVRPASTVEAPPVEPSMAQRVASDQAADVRRQQATRAESAARPAGRD